MGAEAVFLDINGKSVGMSFGVKSDAGSPTCLEANRMAGTTSGRRILATLAMDLVDNASMVEEYDGL